jgi:nucleoid DNA-binding protein
MEKYLIELLESNNRVIVPDLGAFIIRQKEPRELVFNDLLAFNDGMLTTHIKQEEGITMSKSQVKIEEFVDQVKKVLTKGDIYHLENLGYLKMDESSKIEFSVSRFPTVSAEIVSAATLGQQEEAPAEEKPETVDEAPSEEEVPELEGEEEAVPGPDVPEEEIPELELAEEEAFPGSEIPGSEEESHVAEASAEETLEWEAAGESPEASGEDEGFTLEGQDAHAEVDASEDEPLIPQPEEPPFLIEQQPKKEKKATVVGTSQARLEAAAEAAADDEKLESREEPLPEPETSIPYFVQRERSLRDILPWVGGAVALLLILVVAAWFFFPDELNRILKGKPSEMPVAEETLTEEPATALQEATATEDTEAGTETEAAETTTRTDEAGEAAGAVTEQDTETGQADVESEEQAVAEQVTEPEPPAPPAETTKKYYIVAGMFSSRTNAENLENSLKAQGYSAELFGRKNNLYGVSFSSHASRAEAIRELDRIREKGNPKAWLLYY